MTSGKWFFLGFLIGISTVVGKQFVSRNSPQACLPFSGEIQEAQND